MSRRDFYWDAREYSRLARIQGRIRAHQFDASYDQHAFIWGDPGTEGGHALDTVDTDITVAQDGLGDLDKFLRWEIEQAASNADLLLSQSFRLQYRIDTGGGPGSWTDMPTTAGSNPVHIIDHASVTQGGDTTDRGWGTSTFTFITDNNGIADTSSDTGVCTFTADTQQFIEVLYSLRFNDANLGAGDVLDFRVVFGAGGDTTAGTVLTAYTVADATLTWNATSTFVGDGECDPIMHRAYEKEPEVVVFS